jgi:hypothetical protein
MEMTGPEHAAHAEALLSGKARWPHRIGDRMAAANAHATLALVALGAHALTQDDGSEHRADALNYDWRAALPLPYLLPDEEPAVDELDPILRQEAQR